jgi:hypothetical protein
MLHLTSALALGSAAHVAPRSLMQRTHVAHVRASPLASAELPPLGRRGALAALTAGGLALATTGPAFAAEGGRALAYSEFLDEVNKDKVDIVTFSAEGNTLLAIDTEGNRQEVAVLPGQTMDLIELLRKHNVRFSVLSPTQPNALLSIVSSLIVPVLLFGGLTLLTRRGMGGGGGAGGPGGGGSMNPFEMGKSRSKIQLEPETGVVFDDVAGCDASKLELTEVVEFLKNPSKFSALGAKTPRGVIMEGPPGTGKTLLARAVAGEAGVPFISCSGSEFVEVRRATRAEQGPRERARTRPRALAARAHANSLRFASARIASARLRPLRSDVRRRRRVARAQRVLRGEEERAVHHLHRRDRRDRPPARRLGPRPDGRQRRARADAQPDLDRDGRLRGQPGRHRDRGDQPG